MMEDPYSYTIFRKKLRFPTWIPSVAFIAGVTTLQYLWAAWKPEFKNAKLKEHAALYYSGGWNSKYGLHQPQA